MPNEVTNEADSPEAPPQAPLQIPATLGVNLPQLSKLLSKRTSAFGAADVTLAQREQMNELMMLEMADLMQITKAYDQPWINLYKAVNGEEV